MTNPQPHSAQAARRIRALRTTRRLTLAEAAEGITTRGYEISLESLQHIESGRRKSLPFDFVMAAARYFTLGFNGDPDISALLYGPLCDVCHDQPPRIYICGTCRRTLDDQGELTPC